MEPIPGATFDVQAREIPLPMLLSVMFGPDFLTSHDQAIGWLMFLDRFGYPWRDEDCDLETVDAGW